VTVRITLNNPGPERTRSTVHLDGAHATLLLHRPLRWWQRILAFFLGLFGWKPKPTVYRKPIDVKLGPYESVDVSVTVERPGRVTVRQVDARGRVGGTTIELRAPEQAKKKEHVPNSQVIDAEERP
jgi:hypothetical protein